MPRCLVTATGCGVHGLLSAQWKAGRIHVSDLFCTVRGVCSHKIALQALVILVAVPSSWSVAARLLHVQVGLLTVS